MGAAVGRVGGVPIIEVRVRVHRPGSNLVVFYCQWCRCEHIHGEPGQVTGDIGHRVAHCHDPHSPYDKIGYILWVPSAETTHDAFARTSHHPSLARGGGATPCHPLG